jgi:hypothetical protein
MDQERHPIGTFDARRNFPTAIGFVSTSILSCAKGTQLIHKVVGFGSAKDTGRGNSSRLSPGQIPGKEIDKRKL